MNPEKVHEYNNGEITIAWKPGLCIHAAKCVGALPQVYKPGEKPWIKIENATSEELMAQIKTCPSGALSYTMNK
ncbi:MAG: (4Fe-4S)-binding protein [Bacteroidales bacterium]|nr:(4Fe-4S)-binding protein [Bacteroidales bacterium]MCF8454626.1 (4Fe-4S)-binding protein [Bacteroidales bacterium]